MKRGRLKYFLYIIIVIIIGLLCKKLRNIMPALIGDSTGDVLWALMVFLMFGFIFNKNSIRKNIINAIVFSYIIEISQLYHAPWIDCIRATTFGGLVLGYGFSWMDLVSYTVGILIGAGFEKIKEI